MNRDLLNCQVDMSATWAALPNVPDDSGWPETVARTLSDGEMVQKTLATILRANHEDLIGVPKSHVIVGVWVPDRVTGEICGTLDVDLILPDPDGRQTSREEFRALIDPDSRTGIDVYARHLDDLDLPAGPTLLVREIIGVPIGGPGSERALQQNVIYNVFPPGCADSLQLTASTTDLHLGEVMEAGLERGARSLQVHLGHRAV